MVNHEPLVLMRCLDKLWRYDFMRQETGMRKLKMRTY